MGLDRISRRELLRTAALAAATGLMLPTGIARPARGQAIRTPNPRAIRGEERHDGAEIRADLDRDLRIRNTVGTDGLGLCVWASLTMGALYHNCEPLFDLFEGMQRERGGGWPSRVDEKMREKAPEVRYEQWVGDDLSFIRSQVDRGRMVCATYGYGELYHMQTIAHMVCVVGLTDEWACVLDNNDPEHIWWMDPAEYLRRFVHPSNQGWAVAIALPPPPPAPHNRPARRA